MPQVQILQDAPYALLAQLVEQRTLNPKAVGSIPSRRTICTNGGTGIRARLRIWSPSWACVFKSHFVLHIRENARVRSNGADCKSVGNACVGSNPTSPTIPLLGKALGFDQALFPLDRGRAG